LLESAEADEEAEAGKRCYVLLGVVGVGVCFGVIYLYIYTISTPS
jgi:hypothetical protein